jgi:hypothetical protein
MARPGGGRVGRNRIFNLGAIYAIFGEVGGPFTETRLMEALPTTDRNACPFPAYDAPLGQFEVMAKSLREGDPARPMVVRESTKKTCSTLGPLTHVEQQADGMRLVDV